MSKHKLCYVLKEKECDTVRTWGLEDQARLPCVSDN